MAGHLVAYTRVSSLDQSALRPREGIALAKMRGPTAVGNGL